MSGNVLEWCDNLYSSQRNRRAVRGGSWSSYSSGCLGALRDNYAPDNRNGGLGFRACVVVE